jgi:V/A-type H+-transporting ATPase subunit E
MSEREQQVKALREAILQRARKLAEEHVNQGRLTRNRIMQDARDKVQLMEKKELLAARDSADREYRRQIQSSELRMQAELDRNRWGLVQTVLDRVCQRIAELNKDEKQYAQLLYQLLHKGVAELGVERAQVQINAIDHKHFAARWDEFTAGIGATLVLLPQACDCSGGPRITSEDGDMMVDNTFEGMILRREDELMRLIFDRLFSQLSPTGVNHG